LRSAAPVQLGLGVQIEVDVRIELHAVEVLVRSAAEVARIDGPVIGSTSSNRRPR
jgi:hypothetical protein